MIYEKSIMESLQLLTDICKRCQLRLCSIRNSALYLGRKTTNDDIKKTKINPCRLCIGILQDEFMEPTLDKISEDIASGSYDADHFTIAISLPMSLTLRKESIAIYIRRHVPDFDDESIVPIKQVWKWLFPQKLPSKIGKKHVTGDVCEFYVELKINYAEDDEETKSIALMCEEEYKNREQNSKMYHMGFVTRQGIEKSLENVTEEIFQKNYPVPPNIPSNFSFSIHMYHNNVFIAGRYNKYSRELPQTPWIVDGERRLATSVEELLAEPIQKYFCFDSYKFSSSGREDVDVRMLGKGRPFLLELVNPRKTIVSANEFKHVSKMINESNSSYITVRDLQFVPKESIKGFRKEDEEKIKTYSALCVIKDSSFAINHLINKLKVKEIVIQQKTPIRVLHRRTNTIRRRVIYNPQINIIPSIPHKFVLTIATQAGTYVKEFVHGDFGRTVPSVKSLTGYDIDIEALDVEAIDVDWPPVLSE